MAQRACKRYRISKISRLRNRCAFFEELVHDFFVKGQEYGGVIITYIYIRVQCIKMSGDCLVDVETSGALSFTWKFMEMLHKSKIISNFLQQKDWKVLDRFV